MRITRVAIENFRSIELMECDFENVTTFVGPNGAGKSTVLRALEWFFNGEKGWLSARDVFAGADSNRTIKVRVDFGGLTDGDRSALGPRYAPEGVDSFSVWKSWDDGEEKITGRGMALPAFETIRATAGAVDRRRLYKEHADSHPHLGLPPASSGAQVDAAMDEWERNNPEALSPAEISDTHFFGFNGRGKLSHLFDYVFVSADLRAESETSDGRDKILGRILQHAVDRTELNLGVAQLAEDFDRAYAALNEKFLEKQLEGIAQEITAQVATYATGREVRLSASTPSYSPQPPRVDIAISDGTVTTPVGLQGHGLQRTLLLSALTVLSRASRTNSTSGAMFLAVEEPELFQHPTQARAFASVLRDLASQPDSEIQIAYATHSPYFIEPTFFDQIRRITNVRRAKGRPASSVVATASIEAVAAMLETYVEPRSIQRRWNQACLKYLPEALFAESVILVEGDEDAAVLQGLGEGTNDLAIQGISVASVSGKGNMLLPFAILRLLGIPALMVVDNDSGCEARMRGNKRDDHQIEEAVQQHIRTNRTLCRFVGGVQEDFPVGAVTASLAFVPDTLESLLASELPGWDLTRRRLIAEGRGVDGKNAATYELASRECTDSPGDGLSRILALAIGAKAAAA